MSKERRYPLTRFTRACYGEPVDCTPVWMMRQAGRYMPEYRALREKYSFLEFCQTPEVAAQATLDAARILDTDAAIIFSDITIPAWGMGLELEFTPGPRFSPPVRSMEAIEKLRPLDPNETCGFVMDAIRLTRKDLPKHVSLIGFVGAPLTLGAYMAEGYPDKNWVAFKTMLFNEPKTLHALLERVTDSIIKHAIAQVEAGCDAIQLFDTNAGLLPPGELRDFAFRYAGQAIEALKPLGVPVIYFAKGISPYLEEAAALGPDVLGVDWTVSLTDVRKRLGSDVAVMGNLDPTALFASREEVDRRVRGILDEAGDEPGYIFNLGHGILPKTPPENAVQVVQTIRDYCAAR